MYLDFYGLEQKPFALSPDPRFLFLSSSHREALAHLLYGIEQSEGFITVTGEVGTGKTTLCRTLLERLGPETEVAFLFNPSRSGTELLQAIAIEFGLPTQGLGRSQLGDQLNRFLLEKNREGKRVLLIIDEAQNLSTSTLEQVRLLSNLETSNAKLIHILLLGQPELDRKLDSSRLRQLRQRISVRWKLGPLSESETAEYVRHRIKVAAGGPRDLFSAGALKRIHRFTGGVPRLVNVLCDRSLLAGYAAGAVRVPSRIVRAAAREIPDAGRRTGGSPAWRRPALAAGLFGLALLVGVGFGVGAGLGGGMGGGMGGVDLRRWLPAAERDPTPPSVSLAPPRSAAAGAAGSAAPAATLAAADPRPAGSDPAAGPSPRAAANAPAAPDPTASAPATSPRSIVAVVAVPESAPSVRGGGRAALEDAPSLEDEPLLARVLLGRRAAHTRADALDALLASWQLSPASQIPGGFEDAADELAGRGLRSLDLPDTDFDTLEALNHPALLRLQAGDGSQDYWVSLLALDGGVASCFGATGQGPIALRLDELADHWTGEALVVWQPFDRVPELLGPGSRGAGVVWLQSALIELGFSERIPSGAFDAATAEDVRRLQLERGLTPDGVAGPQTQMVLYDLLGRYDVPRLWREGEGAG